MNPDRPLFRGGFCGTPRCSCAAPSMPCDEYMGIPGEDDGWCPRCGWNNAAHDFANRPAPQPNGETMTTGMQEDPAIYTLADLTAFAELARLTPEKSMKPEWTGPGIRVSVASGVSDPSIEVRVESNNATGHNGWTARYMVGVPRSVVMAAVDAARAGRKSAVGEVA